MRNYRQVVDLIQRRIGPEIDVDNIAKIYAEMDEEKRLTYTCILGTSISQAHLTRVAVKYEHIMIDNQDDVDINVLVPTQYFKPSKTCFPIYEREVGFKL